MPEVWVVNFKRGLMDSTMPDYRQILLVAGMVLLCSQQALPQSLELKGQVSGWVAHSSADSVQTQIGVRYIPELSVEKKLSGDYLIDAELSANAYEYSLIAEDEDFDDGEIKLYRMWPRLAGSQFELRGGLQKINFGSATLLRPLMWFDRIDPRDPLQLTDGVYGLLGRYYFLNNANVWLWGLYGNDDPKGWETVPSDRDKVEYGGRVQIPLFGGEIAASYHHREAEPENGSSADSLSATNRFSDQRFGLDGKWDLGVGMWVEAVLVHRDVDIHELRFQRLVTVGLDYTFELGNGLNVLAEHFISKTAEEAFESGEDVSFSAGSASYPLGIIDNLRTIIRYDWDNQDWYHFLNWQRTYDNWIVTLSGFWNPDDVQNAQELSAADLFAGKGVQVMVVFNH